MNKGDLLKLLSPLPDDVEIQVEIDDEDSTLCWASWELRVHVDVRLCPGFEGCTHTEPEPYNDCVFFISRKNQVKTLQHTEENLVKDI